MSRTPTGTAWHQRWRALALGVDVVFVGVALTAIAVARFGPDAVAAGFVPVAGRGFAQAPLLFAIPAWLAAFLAAGLYNPQRCQNSLEEGRRLIVAGLAAAVTLVMAGFVVKENPARSWLVGAVVLGTLSAAMGRKTLRVMVARRRRAGRWTTPTVIVGREQGKAIVESLLGDPSYGSKPVATCGFAVAGIASFGIHEIRAAVDATNAGQVIVVGEGLERSEVASAVEVTDEAPVSVVILPGLEHLLLSSLQLVTVVNEPGLAVEARSLHVWQRAAKRTIDIAAAAAGLMLTSPIMLVVGLLVRVTSAGPAIFRQKREGLRGVTFEALKFRTMRVGADEEIPDAAADLAFLSKPESDPRTTPLGRWLRRTSLDELPQLWNVLRGEMSLVGPRPLPLWEGERLGLRRRLVVRPGLTGLWQVSGRSSLSPEERVRLDLVYVQNWSLLLDLSILLRTVPAVIGGSGAY